MVAGGGFAYEGKSRFGGEIIDVLDAYAHARTARGQSL